MSINNILPFKFKSNRVRRSYSGGYGIDKMRGVEQPSDGEYPEDWIASAVSAFARPGESVDAGLSVVDDSTGRKFAELLEVYPEALLGAEHVKAYGCNTGFLMKLLDSAIRLPVQAHPDNAMAQRLFNTPYGKTEAWMVLSTRESADEEPYLLIGFNEKLDRDVFIAESISGVLDRGLEMMHKVPVRPGDVYMIHGGLPHAIGPGLTVIEIMEPSDWIVVSEKYCGSIVISDERRFNGLEPDRAMEMYDFIPMSREELVEKSGLSPRRIDESRETLIDRDAVRFFGLERLTVSGLYILSNLESCCRAGLVVSGHLEVSGLELNAGDSFFLPAWMDEYEFTGAGQVILALPPVVSA